MTTPQGMHAYTYDTIYQLTGVDYPEGYPFPDMTYTFDPAGNRVTTVDGGTTSYTANNMNEYTDVGGATYTYDANGNLTSEGTNTYAYDSENRLIQVTTPSDTVAFTYDSLGRRISKASSTGTTRYVYDGDQVIAEEDAEGTLLSEFIYGPGIDEPVTLEGIGTGEVYTYHFDGLGSVTEITDATGLAIETYEHSVYGEPFITDAGGQILNDSGVGNPYFFTGRRYDSGTGLFYYRARYYSPTLGRFLQTDPFEYYDNMNFYVYVGNNPLNWIDPAGLCRKPIREKIQETAQTIANITGMPVGLVIVGIAISQADSPAPGPADLIAIGVLSSDIIYYGVYQKVRGPRPEPYPGCEKGKRMREPKKSDPKPAPPSHNPPPDPEPEDNWWKRFLQKVADLLGEMQG